MPARSTLIISFFGIVVALTIMIVVPLYFTGNIGNYHGKKTDQKQKLVDILCRSKSLLSTINEYGSVDAICSTDGAIKMIDRKSSEIMSSMSSLLKEMAASNKMGSELAEMLQIYLSARKEDKSAAELCSSNEAEKRIFEQTIPISLAGYEKMLSEIAPQGCRHH